jgi:hypothetical protein
MTWIARVQSIARPVFGPLLGPVLDYALPPRCPACGDIVSATGAFCAPCWQSIDYIGDPQCRTCGMELPSQAMGEGAQCGACLADPPPFERARALMHYGEVGRLLAHRLKYGRRVSLAHVMASQMQRLIALPGDARRDIGARAPASLAHLVARLQPGGTHRSPAFPNDGPAARDGLASPDQEYAAAPFAWGPGASKGRERRFRFGTRSRRAPRRQDRDLDRRHLDHRRDGKSLRAHAQGRRRSACRNHLLDAGWPERQLTLPSYDPTSPL